jgi:hypothetical protein
MRSTLVALEVEDVEEGRSSRCWRKSTWSWAVVKVWISGWVEKELMHPDRTMATKGRRPPSKGNGCGVVLCRWRLAATVSVGAALTLASDGASGSIPF